MDCRDNERNDLTMIGNNDEDRASSLNDGEDETAADEIYHRSLQTMSDYGQQTEESLCGTGTLTQQGIITAEYPDLRNIFDDRNEYPPGFPNLEKVIYNINITHVNWRTLMDNVWIDGCIINTFLRIVRDAVAASGLKVLVFGTFFSTAPLRPDGFSIG